MVELGSLLLPILVAAVGVFLVSAIIWTAMPHHKTEWRPVPDEEAFIAAVAASGITPGQWFFPKAMLWEEQKDPASRERLETGPKGYLTVKPAGAEGMGKAMGLGFLKDLVIATLVAYVASIGLGAGAEYLDVFRLVAVTYLLAYSAADISAAIWFGLPWRSALLRVVDALVLGLVAGGIFGWLWPAG